MSCSKSDENVKYGLTIGNLVFSENPLAETLCIFNSGWNSGTISSNPRLTSIADDNNHFGGTTRIINNQSLTRIVWSNGGFAKTTFTDNPNLTSVDIGLLEQELLTYLKTPVLEVYIWWKLHLNF